MKDSERKRRSVAVYNIVDWYTKDKPKSQTPMLHRKRKPWNPAIENRWRKVWADPRFNQVKEYKYGRLLGMLNHEALKLFKEEYLPFLHLRINQDQNLALLWYAMRFAAYQAIRTCCDNMMRDYFPQILVFKERLLFESLERIGFYLNILFDQVVARSEKNQKIDEVLEGFEDYLHEKNHSIMLHGLEVNFKPDLLRIDPEFIYVHDFKGSNNNQDRDRFQVILYAYLLEICYFPKRIREITLVYLGDKKEVSITFHDEDRKEAEKILREYLFSKRISISSNVPLHPILEPKTNATRVKNLDSFRYDLDVTEN